MAPSRAGCCDGWLRRPAPCPCRFPVIRTAASVGAIARRAAAAEHAGRCRPARSRIGVELLARERLLVARPRRLTGQAPSARRAASADSSTAGRNRMRRISSLDRQRGAPRRDQNHGGRRRRFDAAEQVEPSSPDVRREVHVLIPSARLLLRTSSASSGEPASIDAYRLLQRRRAKRSRSSRRRRGGSWDG